MRSETTASRRTLGLKTCVTSEEFVRQVRDEWREAQANLARLARQVVSNAHASARERKARHASMECSAIEPARSSESGPSTSTHPRYHMAFDVVALTGVSATPPQDIVSVSELWTPQALALKREKTFSALDISKCEATRPDRSNNILIPLNETAEHSRACVKRTWVTWLFFGRWQTRCSQRSCVNVV